LVEGVHERGGIHALWERSTQNDTKFLRDPSEYAGQCLIREASARGNHQINCQIDRDGRKNGWPDTRYFQANAPLP